MRCIFALLAAAVLGVGAAWGQVAAPQEADAPKASAPMPTPATALDLAARDVAWLTQSQSTLGFRLIEAMARQPGGDGNLMVSPASLAAVMTLLNSGADADMRAALYKVLGLETDASGQRADRLAALHAGVKAMQSDAEGPLRSASAIVFDPEAAPYPHIAAKLGDAGAQVTVEDLNDPATLTRINRWVASRTRGLIPSIIEHAPPEPGLIALNAVHFKDRWRDAFEAAVTRPAAFHGFGGAEDVAMMQRDGSLRLREQEGFVAVELPYASDRFRLVVITTRAQPARAAEFAGVAGWLAGAGFESRPGELSMPRFRMSGSADLLTPLDTLGLAPARLSPGALAGLSPATMIIAQVLQRTEIRVDEAGTEAAAATAVTTTRAIATDFAKVAVDKPFLFALRDAATGLVLLTGYVANPR
jgi:serine protease inhibitor